jgi:hypothetical protein
MLENINSLTSPSFKRRPLAVALASALAMSAAGFHTSAAAQANDVRRDLEELRRQHEVLSKRLMEMERKQSAETTASPAPAPLDAASAQRLSELETKQTRIEDQQKNLEEKARTFVHSGEGSPPKSWTLPGTNTSIRVGGIAALDSIYDLGFSGGTAASFSAIPMSGTPRAARTGTFQMHAQNSRLFVDIRSSNTKLGLVRAYADFDFSGRVGALTAPATPVATAAGNPMITNSYVPRLRYAYVNAGPFTIGQTDSTFIDVAAAPFFMDPSGPTGQTKIRQGLIRYTMPVGEQIKGERPIGTNLQFSLENPEGDYTQRSGPASSVLTGTNLSPTSNRLPDLHARVNFDRSWGHMSVAGLYRRIAIDDGAGNRPSVGGWGLMSAVSIPTWGKDKFTGQIAHGDGIGRYIPDAVNSGATSPDGKSLNTQRASSAWASYTHWWSPELRSAVAFGRTWVRPNRADVPASMIQTRTSTFHTNLVYTPQEMPDLLLGVEYVFGKRELATGQSGYLRRLSASAWYFF